MLLDTNVLPRARDSAEPEHQTVCACIDRLIASGNEVCYCLQNLIEAWSVITRPRDANGWGFEPASASNLLDEIVSSFVRVEEPRDLQARWNSLCVLHAVRGRQTYDAGLVGVMLGHGIRDLVTLNEADFRRYDEIRCIVPGRG